MRLDKLYLKDYRSYPNLLFEPDRHLNVLVGENATGKTNLLESIYYLAAGRSQRTHRDQQLLRWGKSSFFIKASLIGEPVRHTVEILYHKDRGKSFRVDGVRQSAMLDAIGLVNAVIFSPDDLSLLKGGPSERRSFIDSEIGQVNRPYQNSLSRYNRILSQRNDVLRNLRASNYSRSTEDLLLEPWDLQLAESGAAIVAARLRLLRRWAAGAADTYGEVAGTTERFTMSYQCSFLGEVPLQTKGEGTSIAVGDMQSQLLERLTDSRAEEVGRGHTVVGPHRDDLAVYVDERDARHFASQGQQRSAALAMRIAEVGWMEEEIKRRPLLLLDDVMSELDAKRARRLARLVGSGVQTFITCTDLSDLRLGSSFGTIWHTGGGEVKQIAP
ncbi:MAG: DNA replication/repair protein RecF, partial [Bacillota bacterium]